MERATVDKAAQPKGVEGSTVAEAFELTASRQPGPRRAAHARRRVRDHVG